MRKLITLLFVISSFVGLSQNGFYKGWGFSGDAVGTNTAFIGTIDNRPFNIRVNNAFSGIIDTLGTTSLGYRSGYLNSVGSNSLTSFGTNSGRYNVLGVVNSVFGCAAGSSTAFSGNSDSYFGYNAGRDCSSGGNNSYFGESAGRGMLRGGGNTALGKAAMLLDTAGTGNVCLGFDAGRYGQQYSNRVFINGIDRVNFAADTTNSIIYGYQNTSVSSQTIYLNANIRCPQTLSVTGTATLGANSKVSTNLIGAELIGSATLNFPSTLTQQSSDLTITVTGAADGDPVMIGVPNAALTAGAVYWAWVSSANTVTIRFYNSNSGSQDPASATFKVTVNKN